MKHESSNGLIVEYKYRESREDNAHLVVVFSGFRPEKSPYDFDGKSSEYLKSNILWIRDSFRGKMCYYIRSDQGFDVDFAVHELIESVRLNLGLTAAQCTLVGFSKGASAALYHALKYDYGNLVISAPRINLGQGNLDRPYILEAMTTASSEEEITELDQIIPSVLRSASKSTNVYLFSSEQDHLHSTETATILDELRKFKNFNYVLTNSQLVRRHKDVTLYNIHLIISLIQILGDGITPKLGETSNGNEKYTPVPDNRDNDSLVPLEQDINISIDAFRITDTSLRIRGSACFRGLAASTSSDYRVALNLHVNGTHQKFLGTQTKNIKLSSKFYHKSFVDYSFAGFEISVGRNDLTNLDNGIYDLSLLVRHKSGLKRQIPMIHEIPQSYKILGASMYSTRPGRGKQLLVKTSLLEENELVPARESFWHSLAISQTGLLEASGRLNCNGLFVLNYSDADYFLLLRNLESNSIHSRNLYSTNKIRSKQKIDNTDFYEYSGFATYKFRGLDLSGIPDGVYEISVMGLFAGHTRSRMKSINTLRIQSGKLSFVTA